MVWRDCSLGRSREERLRGSLANLPSRNIHWRRRLSNGLALGAFTLAALIVTVPLFLILATVVYRGLPALTWSFFTQIPKPMGEIGGGIAHTHFRPIVVLAVGPRNWISPGVCHRGFFAGDHREKGGHVVPLTSNL